MLVSALCAPRPPLNARTASISACPDDASAQVLPNPSTKPSRFSVASVSAAALLLLLRAAKSLAVNRPWSGLVVISLKSVAGGAASTVSSDGEGVAAAETEAGRSESEAAAAIVAA